MEQLTADSRDADAQRASSVFKNMDPNQFQLHVLTCLRGAGLQIITEDHTIGVTDVPNFHARVNVAATLDEPNRPMLILELVDRDEPNTVRTHYKFGLAAMELAIAKSIIAVDGADVSGQPNEADTYECPYIHFQDSLNVDAAVPTVNIAPEGSKPIQAKAMTILQLNEAQLNIIQSAIDEFRGNETVVAV